ncbi:MAG: radical SAM protein, partial [Candidatus Hydrogenedentota bacterium]
MNIVLANSIGIDSNGYYIVHSPSRWSFGVKNYSEVFTYYPWELAYTSSLLKKETNHNVRFIDGCLNKLDAEVLYSVILNIKPDILIMEPSARTITEDLKVANYVKRDTNCIVIFTGAYATFFYKDLLEKRIIDHTVSGEYEESILEFIKGKAIATIPGFDGNRNTKLVDFNKLPWPEDNDVSRYKYALQGEPNCEYREIQAYASRGCVYRCNFCAAANLYYNKP